MRQLFLGVTIATVLVLPAGGQAWTPQLGIESGFARLKPAGTGQRDHIDLWELPGTGSAYATVFMIVPLAPRVAMEPAIAGVRTTIDEASGFIPRASSSNVRVTLRANIALGAGFYVAAGGMIRYRQSNDAHDMQSGVLAALGYRLPISADLLGRIEARWIAQRRTDSIAPSSVHALLFGFSRRLGATPARTSDPDSRSSGDRHWDLGLGLSGGYVRNHLYGSAFGLYLDVQETVVYLPGSGSASIPALFLIMPLRGRLALESGFHARRTQQQDNTLFDGHVSARLNIAVVRGVYLAAGGAVRYLERTGTAGFAFAGAVAAAGYRFPLMSSVNGRLEANFAAFKERQDFPFAQNSAAVLLGIVMTVK